MGSFVNKGHCLNLDHCFSGVICEIRGYLLNEALVNSGHWLDESFINGDLMNGSFKMVKLVNGGHWLNEVIGDQMGALAEWGH